MYLKVIKEDQGFMEFKKVRGFLHDSAGDLIINFEDGHEKTIKKDEISYFYAFE